MGVDIFNKHFNNRDKIGILIDEDVDGFCSAAEMYLYIKDMDENYPVIYIMHNKAKAHGLSVDVQIPSDIGLLIIPDAGTNDYKQCNELYTKNGTDILILDHHEKEETGEKHEYAVVINNQTSKKYSNKDLCGAGVVYKFLQALDDYYWQDYSERYIDLCALANISDNMNVTSYETKYYIESGLKQISNKCFTSMINAQDYSMHGHVNMHNIAWYITSIINGCIRFGSKEEKDLLFRAFIETDEMFEYKKRATKDKPAETLQESIYDRAARLCKNAKSRQDKAREKATDVILNKIDAECADKVIVYDVTSIVDTSLTGVVAIKIADILKRPVVLLQKHIHGDHIVYGGSARNIDHSPIDSFKDVVNQTGVANGVGHANAFGIVGLSYDDKEKFVDELNSLLKNTTYNSVYNCDYTISSVENEITISFINSLVQLEDYVGTGISEPMIAVTDLRLSVNDFQIIGKNSDTYKFVINDIEFVKFKCKSDDIILDWLNTHAGSESEVEFEIVGRPSVNIYNGIKTMQVIIEDVNILDQYITSINDDIWCENNNNDDEIAW